jgi:enoyl-CoA hydratase
MFDKYKLINFERRGAILTITLNSPPANAVDHALHEEMTEVFVDAQRDPDSRVVVVTGAGRCFSAGGNLEMLLAACDDQAGVSAMMRQAPRIIHSLLALEKPTIAWVNGHAMGLGASLALLCDIVFMNETAKIADPHVSIGLSTGDGGALIWPHLIGYARARHYLFTGEPLSGAEAAAIGLIHKAGPNEQLGEQVYAYAERLAAMPYVALSGTKKSINMALARQALSDAEAHLGLEMIAMATDDHREALRALSEKRPPVFTHGRH